MPNPESKLNFTLTDPNVYAQLLGLAEKNKVTLSQVGEFFIHVGSLTYRHTLFSRDKMGFEKPVHFMDGDFAPEPGGEGSRMNVNAAPMPEFMENACKEYGVSPGELLTRICKLGIRIAQAKDNYDMTYILKREGKRDVDFKTLRLFEE